MKNFKFYLNKINESIKIKSLNEGIFTWFTLDTNQQIGISSANRITVYMYDDKGNKWEESRYEGYGEFGGKDYYELLAEMNGYKTREDGISLAFGDKKTKNESGVTIFPALVTDPNYNINNHNFEIEAESDPDQGDYWIVDDEDEDEYMYESNSNKHGLRVSVYKSPLGDSTANGLTSKVDQLLLYDENMSGAPVNIDEDEDYLVLVKKKWGNKEFQYAVPKSILDEGVHSMFGGNFVYSSDSRFPSNNPIKVHDRVERR